MTQQPFAFPFADFMIQPRTTWERFYNPQFFVSVNAGDAPIENHVLGRVGSYGRQLGTILDALAVLAERVPVEDLPREERRALDALVELREDVERAKADFRGGPPSEEAATEADLDGLLRHLEELRDAAPQRHRRLVRRLRDALEE